MRPFRQIVLVLALVVFGWASAQAATFKSDDTLTYTEPVASDLFTAGNTINLNAPVAGELYAAGSDVSITKPAARSVFAAGSSVTIKDGVGYNVFAAGNTVTLGGKIGHDVYVAGNTVIFEEGTEVMGDVRAAGKSVILRGKIHGNVITGAESTTSSANVDGNFTADGNKLVFTDGSVGGDLTYTTQQTAEGLSSVTVKGTTTHHQPSTADNNGRAVPQRSHNVATTWLFALLGMLVVGAILLLIMPNRIGDIYHDVRTTWGKQFLTGLAIVVLAGPIALALLFTVVGWPLAILIGLVTASLLLIGHGIAGLLVGQLVMDVIKLKGSWWEALIIGALVVTILGAIPFIAPLIMLLVAFGIILPAIGSLAHALWFNLRAKA